MWICRNIKNVEYVNIFDEKKLKFSLYNLQFLLIKSSLTYCYINMLQNFMNL